MSLSGRATLGSALLVAALASCGGAPSANDARMTNGAQAANGAAMDDGNAIAAGAGNAAQAGSNAVAGDVVPGQEIMLERRGLAVGMRGLHPGQFYEFGRPQAEVVAMATAVRGRPTGSGRNEECGEGPIDYVDFGNLRINFQQGRFVGWDASPGGPPVRNEWGLGIGSPRADLEGETDPPLRVQRSTLGIEFESDGYGGLLSSNRPDATVTDIWAGLICAFR
jgi:hypothetical protein